jgi:hypothetical protein
MAVPIHDLGYRAWKGRGTPQLLRWWVITQTGLKIAWKNFWLRRLLFLAWIPAFYFGAGFFIYEQWLTYVEESLAVNPGARAALETQLRQMGAPETPGARVRQSRRAMMTEAPALAEMQARNEAMERARRQMGGLLPGLPLSLDRHDVWCWLMWMYFRHPQGLLMLLVVGMVAPPLVARDVGSRAFLLYFSRPINRVEYIAGKLAIVWSFVLLISAAPALALYVLGVLLSPDFSVVGPTWDLPFRILVATSVLLIPTTTLALAMSSMTTKSWVAGFAWFAVWIFGIMAYTVLWTSLQVRTEFEGPGLGEHWTLLSLYHTLGKVQGWVFGVEGTLTSILPSVGLLLVLTVVCLAVLFRRVSSPMRI